MHRKLYNEGAAVYGWINIDKKQVEIFAYSKGYIGRIKDKVIYDENNQKIGITDEISIEQYIINRNDGIDKNYMRRKLKHEPKVITFKGGN